MNNDHHRSLNGGPHSSPTSGTYEQNWNLSFDDLWHFNESEFDMSLPSADDFELDLAGLYPAEYTHSDVLTFDA